MLASSVISPSGAYRHCHHALRLRVRRRRTDLEGTRWTKAVAATAASAGEQGCLLSIPKEGERIVAPTSRPGDTNRKAIRIHAGYLPQKEVAIYQSKGAQVIPPHHPHTFLPHKTASSSDFLFLPGGLVLSFWFVLSQMRKSWPDVPPGQVRPGARC
ncbi:hypothetical protein E2562_000044 [Oryza meyeriana var. granulata]|uniref:WIBG Mago-binding domain-containing protein n=1 Tax=Oryza meyeriana var. granulata TaxID=110450 RepID=A0A6G1DB78_9ORYZ|nr:hypothetical protein E2562_000044 [Oryza meyeriana var. granulata]KAF0909708.1 hypothetical protein E2562_000044 [Oryza meyeriana var. granulata]